MSAVFENFALNSAPSKSKQSAERSPNKKRGNFLLDQSGSSYFVQGKSN